MQACRYCGYRHCHLTVWIVFIHEINKMTCRMKLVLPLIEPDEWRIVVMRTEDGRRYQVPSPDHKYRIRNKCSSFSHFEIIPCVEQLRYRLWCNHRVLSDFVFLVHDSYEKEGQRLKISYEWVWVLWPSNVVENLPRELIELQFPMVHLQNFWVLRKVFHGLQFLITS